MFCQLPAAFVGGKCQRCSGYYKVGTVVFFWCVKLCILFHFNFNFAICNSRFWLLLRQWTIKFCDDNLNQILQKYGPPKTCDQCKQKSAFDRGVNTKYPNIVFAFIKPKICGNFSCCLQLLAHRTTTTSWCVGLAVKATNAPWPKPSTLILLGAKILQDPSSL